MSRNSILITILFLTIGFATVSTTLLIKGNTSVGVNQDDFNVYFSNALVNGVKDWNVIKSDREIEFSTTMKSKNETYVLDYDVTNGSKNYDAQVTISCTGGNSYLSVNNEFDTTNNLVARETRSGTLTITLTKQYTGDSLETEVKCTIIANGVERTELNEVEIPATIPEYYVGKEIAIGEELFNVISYGDGKISMLAKLNLGTDYKQNKSNNTVHFATSAGWAYTPGPKEVDVVNWSSTIKTYFEEYVTYLNDVVNSSDITADLISLEDLENLGCVVPENYAYSSDSTTRTCANSEHVSWLSSNFVWWTKSAHSLSPYHLWFVDKLGNPIVNGSIQMNNALSVRPVITISIESLESYLKYEVGNELIIENEVFNVISSTEDTVTLFAQKALNSQYRQSDDYEVMQFSQSQTWDAGVDIVLEDTDGEVRRYVSQYVAYLKEETGDESLSGTIITLGELKSLGCVIDENMFIEGTCSDSKYSSWLFGNNDSWIRTSNDVVTNFVWYSYGEYLYAAEFDGCYIDESFTEFIAEEHGVRPVITMSKDTYDRYYNS